MIDFNDKKVRIKRNSDGEIERKCKKIKISTLNYKNLIILMKRRKRKKN